MAPKRQLEMAQREELGFLQSFVDPKRNFLSTGRRNFVIRAQWSPHICLVNARVNQSDMDRHKAKINVYDRAVTFEGGPEHSIAAAVSDRLANFLKEACTNVVRFLEVRSLESDIIITIYGRITLDSPPSSSRGPLPTGRADRAQLPHRRR